MRFVAEEDDDGRLAGIAYGYRAARAMVADLVGEAMTDEQRALALLATSSSSSWPCGPT